MKTMVKQPNPDPPYSLHDACSLKLLRGGYPAPYHPVRLCVHHTACNQVEETWRSPASTRDFSCVYVMEYQGVLCGNYGSFTGRKMTVADFLREYSEATLDIMDETYGYHQVKLDGFLNVGERCLEFQLDICYAGEFRYLLKE